MARVIRRGRPPKSPENEGMTPEAKRKRQEAQAFFTGGDKTAQMQALGGCFLHFLICQEKITPDLFKIGIFLRQCLTRFWIRHGVKDPQSHAKLWGMGRTLCYFSNWESIKLSENRYDRWFDRLRHEIVKPNPLYLKALYSLYFNEHGVTVSLLCEFLTITLRFYEQYPPVLKRKRREEKPA